jgi:serine/threonine-protein kinase
LIPYRASRPWFVASVLIFFVRPSHDSPNLDSTPVTETERRLRCATPTAGGLRLVGPYEIHDEIGSGGMATVHLGRATTANGSPRVVAIKRLHPHHARNAEFVSMLVDEARIASCIVHPNVVRTLDVVAADGELVVVMEHVHGLTLADLLQITRDRRRAIPVAIAAAIAVDVLEGLQAAHEATDAAGAPLGVVHRDVSPQNVIVGTDGRARILDFGVAKASGRVHDTRNGAIKGKPAYMAPEQVDGLATALTDVYAATILLWEMLTSRRLFLADTDVETLARILGTTIEPPSRHRASVPPPLDAVALAGLAREPEDRFPSARAMASALRRATTIAPREAVAIWVQACSDGRVRSVAEKIAAMESGSGVRLRWQPPKPRRARRPERKSEDEVPPIEIRIEHRARSALVLVVAIVLTAVLTTATICWSCVLAR